jgi:hypothetical protein
MEVLRYSIVNVRLNAEVITGPWVNIVATFLTSRFNATCLDTDVPY